MAVRGITVHSTEEQADRRDKRGHGEHAQHSNLGAEQFHPVLNQEHVW